MPGKKLDSLIRLICITLWMLIVGGLYYQNQMLQKRIRTLEQVQISLPVAGGCMTYSAGEIALALGALKAENKTYRANLKRQATNLKECMLDLSQSEIDGFHRRHREELRDKSAE